jgi:hypothetical protein
MREVLYGTGIRKKTAKRFAAVRHAGGKRTKKDAAFLSESGVQLTG